MPRAAGTRHEASPLVPAAPAAVSGRAVLTRSVRAAATIAALAVAAATLSTPAEAASRSVFGHRHLHVGRTTPPSDPAALCEAAIHHAETRYATPPALLRAISLVETGRPNHGALRAWPWSVDVDGAPFFFPSRDAAVGFTRTVLLAGARSVDVGCMQVNLETHPDAFATLEDGFDPAINVGYATRFLLALHAGPAHLVWSTAVGFYHSQTEALASPYRARVIAIDDTLLPGTASLGDASLDAASLQAGLTQARIARPGPETPEQRMKKAWAATIVADQGDN